MHTFTPDSLFGIQQAQSEEWHLATADGLNWMQQEGVTAIWLDIANVNIMGESLSHFYCTYRGKSPNPPFTTTLTTEHMCL